MASELKIRPAAIAEAEIIYSFIEKKAEFDRNIGAFSGKIETSAEKIRQTVFNSTPFAQVLFAEIEQPIGFALYYFRYSSFRGLPSIWLDDLYIDEGFRSKGAGAALMSYLAQEAQNNCCTHLAWTADIRNIRTVSFYHCLGAKIALQNGNVCFFQWIP
ncbi:GNAT family N-acetyltransferase [Synechocystis sp. PCC 7509]|uniref:GNAT family N-acetyltransferase n=1 Tax=Synechocystis sp. PCC 7509 TaxID=927677 RepID=UPI0002AC4DBC|nr:GNAT family N-acetyltransferase [Synechocystis sp. PCC 7509]